MSLLMPLLKQCEGVFNVVKAVHLEAKTAKEGQAETLEGRHFGEFGLMRQKNLLTCREIFGFYLSLMVDGIFLVYKKMMVTSELEFNSFLEDLGQLYRNFQSSVLFFLPGSEKTGS